MIFNNQKEESIFDEKKDNKDKFICFFNSIEMNGWKTWKDFDIFWKLKKISAFLFFMAVFSFLLNLAIFLYPQDWKSFEMIIKHANFHQFIYQMKVDARILSFFTFICINLLSSLYFGLLWFLKIDELITKFQFNDVAKSHIAYKITTHKIYLEYIFNNFSIEDKQHFIKYNPQYKISDFDLFKDNFYQVKTIDFIFSLYHFFRKK